MQTIETITIRVTIQTVRIRVPVALSAAGATLHPHQSGLVNRYNGARTKCSRGNAATALDKYVAN